jgi:transcriptional regulator with XRE-family HTH domain
MLLSYICSMNPFELGRELRRLRRAAGMTQVALSERAGITQGYLSEIERGAANPGPEVVRAVFEALGVSLVTELRPLSGSGQPVTLAERLAAVEEKLSKQERSMIELILGSHEPKGA